MKSIGQLLGEARFEHLHRTQQQRACYRREQELFVGLTTIAAGHHGRFFIPLLPLKPTTETTEEEQ